MVPAGPNRTRFGSGPGIGGKRTERYGDTGFKSLHG